MKTAEDILDSQGKDINFDYWNGKMTNHLKVLAIEGMKEYAKQFIDLALKKSIDEDPSDPIVTYNELTEIKELI